MAVTCWCLLLLAHHVVATTSVHITPASPHYASTWSARLKTPLTDIERAALYTAGIRVSGESSLQRHDSLELGTLVQFTPAAPSIDVGVLLNHLLPSYKIERVSRDIVTYATSYRSPVAWNLDRLDSRALNYDTVYRMREDGAGVNVYVLDTGINASLHMHFEHRVSTSLSFDAFGENSADCDGHGTHVAGIVGSSQYGVAPGVRIFNVRVLDCSGRGDTYRLALGLAWVFAHGTLPAIVNLGMGYYGQALVVDDLTKWLYNAGFVLIAGVGNERLDSCTHYPSALPWIVSVASTNRVDVSSVFNNIGTCITLFAPGEQIPSAWHVDGSQYVLDGSSMAAAHVSGVAALYLQTHRSASPQQVANRLTLYTTKNVVVNTHGATSQLLYAYINDN